MRFLYGKKYFYCTFYTNTNIYTISYGLTYIFFDTTKKHETVYNKILFISYAAYISSQKSYVRRGYFINFILY